MLKKKTKYEKFLENVFFGCMVVCIFCLTSVLVKFTLETLFGE